MDTDSTKPLAGVDTGSVAPGDIEESEVRAALSSSNPLVTQWGLEACETLAEADVDAVRPFLDEVAAFADDSNSALALRAIAVLDAVASAEPAALDGRVSALAGAMGTDIVDVQLTGATALGKLVVPRPDIVAPHVRRLVEGVRETELQRELEEFAVVDDDVTRQTLREKEESERRRRVSARRTLVNVVVAVAEAEPESAVGCVDDLVALFDDIDPGVAGGAVDAVGEVAAVDPEAVAPVADRLVDCLDHDRTVVRARAVRALGRLGPAYAEAPTVERLRALADADDDENVREVAADTADYLAGGS
ncbi:HEAT repeat domain-containing protein [Candidatus Halobonum tyrrellensis]|uniref:Adaptin n=1 Tax=Candidatus Halobonum tyrrellensis G22 TaxID=1324957 RepID=V4H8S4_9EURY|nr:HEAT repeat domain-containing protein [Candidatus Halobonum tyrrellensis]ESP87120.1 Adaptin [Candidatus Halobonum tyrrellensis G22]